MCGSRLCSCPCRWLRVPAIALGAVALGALAQAMAQPPVDLPQPLGAISDYGAQLGRSTRIQLQTQIDDLYQEAGIRVYVLVTLLDPFGNPSVLAERIWEAWALDEGEDSEKTVLLLFVREGEPWAFRWRAGSALAPQLRSPEMRETWEAVTALVEERKIAQAVREGVGGLHRFFVGPSPEPTPSPPSKEQRPSARTGRTPIWLYVVWGFFGLLALLGGLIAYALVWLCPECGARLQRSPIGAYGLPPGPRSLRSSSRRGARGARRGWVYYCRRCGYRRVRSGGERGRGPRRR